MKYIPSRKGFLRNIVIIIITLIAMAVVAFIGVDKGKVFETQTTVQEVEKVDICELSKNLKLNNYSTLPNELQIKDYLITFPNLPNSTLLQPKTGNLQLCDLPEVNNEEEVKEPEKTIDELVVEVLDGKAGNGQDRVNYLGDKYDEVMKIVNEKVKQEEAKKVKKQTQQKQATSSQSKSELQNYAHQLVLERGWSEYDFECLVNLWNRESGWNPNAHNKSSGAHGIPQSLPASKMASEGSDYYTNGYTQIRWGLKYIAGRYGTPANAWQRFQNKHWY